MHYFIIPNKRFDENIETYKRNKTINIYILIYIISTDCGAASSPVNGLASTPDGTTEGGTAIYTCDSGYIMVGSTRAAVCLTDGSWSSPAPFCRPGKAFNIARAIIFAEITDI